MSDDINNKDKTTRREFIHIATTTVGAVGAGCVALPLVTQMNPDASVKALAKVEVDISKIEKGNEVTVMWRGKPIFIRRRTDEEVSKARQVSLKDLKDPQKDQDRVKKGKDEWLVMLGVCTHLGCVPLKDKGDYKGWFCPCHGSHYDVSGRIRKGPAPKNMEIPKFEFLDKKMPTCHIVGIFLLLIFDQLHSFWCCATCWSASGGGFADRVIHIYDAFHTT